MNYLDIAVVGLHLNNQKLNYQLTDLNAKYIITTQTSKCYHFYLIDDGISKKPALIRQPEGVEAFAYEVEIWRMPIENIGKFLQLIPSPLGLGTVYLENGETVKGFIGEFICTTGKNISHFKGWRDYTQSDS